MSSRVFVFPVSCDPGWPGSASRPDIVRSARARTRTTTRERVKTLNRMRACARPRPLRWTRTGPRRARALGKGISSLPSFRSHIHPHSSFTQPASQRRPSGFTSHREGAAHRPTPTRPPAHSPLSALPTLHSSARVIAPRARVYARACVCVSVRACACARVRAGWRADLASAGAGWPSDACSNPTMHPPAISLHAFSGRRLFC